MEKIQGIIHEFIESDRYGNTTINYDINSLKIRLYENDSEDRYVLFYIYSPWRILGDGEIVNSSDRCPSEEFSDSKEAHEVEFEEYTKSTQELSKQKIISLKIDPITCDLAIRWEGGSYLEAFTLDSDSEQYHIYDKLNLVTYDISYGNVSSSKMKSK